tara:strand:- start:570 stop:1460 length:891 start_codon:yes stop_codon:yes gene_type:complete
MLPAVLFLVRGAPEPMGLRPDGDPPLASGELPKAPDGVDFKTAVRSRYFVLISVTFIICMAAQVGAIQHTFKMTKDRIDIDTARAVLMVLSATSVIARILGGIAALKMSLTRLTVGLMVVQSSGIGILALADSKPMIMVGAVVLGMAMGNLLMFHPLLLADAFGVKDYPRIYGMGSLVMVLGVGIGPFLVGVIRDLASYRVAFGVITVFAIVAIIFLLAAGTPPVFGAVEVDQLAPAVPQAKSHGVMTLTPPDRIPSPPPPPKRRVAVVDRGQVMGAEDFPIPNPASREIPLKTAE